MSKEVELVGSASAASAINRSVVWVRSMVKAEFVNDLRRKTGKSRRMVFSLFEMYQLTALASASKAGSLRRVKYAMQYGDFILALDKYLSSGDVEFYWMVNDSGYLEGWSFQALDRAAQSNMSAALYEEQRLPAHQRLSEKLIEDVSGLLTF